MTNCQPECGTRRTCVAVRVADSLTVGFYLCVYYVSLTYTQINCTNFRTSSCFAAHVCSTTPGEWRWQVCVAHEVYNAV